MSALPASTRLESRSQTAMMRASSYCQMPGRSWPREMRPTPMAPTLMRLLGAICPKTEDGRMVGKPTAAVAAAAVLRKLRRETALLRCMVSPLNAGVRCSLLGADDELRGEQALCLVLGCVRAVDDVGDELRAEREGQVIAVDVAGLFGVHEVEVIAALVFGVGDVGVLADFDVAVGTEDEEAAVAPGAEARGREPVEAHVAEAGVAAEHHVAEVLEFGVIFVADVGDLGRDDLRLSGAGVEEELIDLVGADVAENATVFLGVPE